MATPDTPIQNHGAHLFATALFGVAALALTVLCNLHWSTGKEGLAAAGTAMLCGTAWTVMHASRPEATRRTTLYVLVQAASITLLMQTAFLLSRTL